MSLLVAMHAQTDTLHNPVKCTTGLQQSDKLHAEATKLADVQVAATQTLEQPMSRALTKHATVLPQIPLLVEDETRKYSLLPIVHDELWGFYQEHMNCFWTPREIDLSDDHAELKRKNPDGSSYISDDEKHFLKQVLCFFAASDFIVAENMTNFMQLVQIQEAKMFYAFQIAMENVHSETYGRLIEMFCSSRQEQQTLNQSVVTNAAVRAKAQWAQKWMDESQPFVTRLIAFAIIEGVFFSGSFCSIFWFKKQGKLLNGLCKSNEYISRDESIHTRFALHVYKEHIPAEHKLSTKEITDMFLEAYELECAFIIDAIPVRLLGMNQHDMTHYIEFIVDYWLLHISLPPLFMTPNPFNFMEMLSMEGKTNFFEQRVTEYSPANLHIPTKLDFGDEEF